MKWLVVALLSLVLAGGVDAKEAGALLRSSQPITVKSDHLASDTTNRTATFSGRVIAQQGDLTIVCDQLLIRYAVKGSDVDEVVASGNVRISQGERLAFAGRAVYDNAAGVIRLEDKPRILRGEDTINRALITYYVNESKSDVTGGPGERVEAVIRPGGELKRVPGRK